MKIENVQLVTHLGCHKFNEERKNGEEECAKMAAICLSYLQITYDVQIIIRKLKLNFTLKRSRAVCTYILFACSSLLWSNAKQYVFTGNHCRLSALSLAIIIHKLISIHIPSYAIRFGKISLSNIHDSNSITNTNVLTHCFLFFLTAAFAFFIMCPMKCGHT